MAWTKSMEYSRWERRAVLRSERKCEVDDAARESSEGRGALGALGALGHAARCKIIRCDNLNWTLRRLPRKSRVSDSASRFLFEWSCFHPNVHNVTLCSVNAARTCASFARCSWLRHLPDVRSPKQLRSRDFIASAIVSIYRFGARRIRQIHDFGQIGVELNHF